jgi:hypothetical protein
MVAPHLAKVVVEGSSPFPRSMRLWFSGRIRPSQGWGMGSIPIRRTKALLVFNGSMAGFQPAGRGSNPLRRSRLDTGVVNAYIQPRGIGPVEPTDL